MGNIYYVREEELECGECGDSIQEDCGDNIYICPDCNMVRCENCYEGESQTCSDCDITLDVLDSYIERELSCYGEGDY